MPSMGPVYLDHCATTPLDPRVARVVARTAQEFPGNPDSPHQFGRRARARLEEARREVAQGIGADPGEIIFTSGGTESCNLALRGVARAASGRHLVVTAVEHPAVLRCAEALEEEGFLVDRVPVDRDGIPDPEEFGALLRPDTILASAMMANNETGAILPVRELAVIARDHGVPFHTDAVQALGKIPVPVTALGVDLLSGAAHKFHGPRGAGFLYARRGTVLAPLLHGGHQENGLRPGTADVPGAAGLAAALTLANREMEQHAAHLRRLGASLEAGLLTRPGVTLNGPAAGRLPGIVNVTVRGVAAEALMIALDREGFLVGTGSACATGAALPSHVLAAMGRDPREVASSLRISPGRGTTPEEIDRFHEAFAVLVGRLRRRSSGPS